MNQGSSLKLNRLYLCAPVNALVEGIYEQKIPFTEVKQFGNFGIGTFDNLDGEMVMLDGQIFQINSDGRVNQVPQEALTPFSCVTFYNPLSHDSIDKAMFYNEFQEWLLSLLPSTNIFYALRIEGVFSHIKVRSVPKQENYKPLVEVAKEQPEFIFSNIEGTLAGFFTPSFMASVSVPGLHLHFLSADFQHGGHLLECTPLKAKAGIQLISTLELALPMSLDYLTLDFQRDIAQDLDKAEK